jgi:hypothetical protein
MRGLGLMFAEAKASIVSSRAGDAERMPTAVTSFRAIWRVDGAGGAGQTDVDYAAVAQGG